MKPKIILRMIYGDLLLLHLQYIVLRSFKNGTSQMPQAGSDGMNSKIHDQWTDELFKAILLLENTEECYNFFEDICTISEIKAMAQRLEVAKMLKEGYTYMDISEKTGASTATISRVNRSLNYGADGYRIVLERLDTKGR